MPFPDAHRHGQPLAGTCALVSCSLGKHESTPSGAWSLGVHPWHLLEEPLAPRLEELGSMLEHREGSRLVAIGECGLDRAVPVPWELQLQAFRAQIRLASTHSLPLVLHVVRAFPEVLKEHRDAKTPWLVHGFRGGPALALDLWRHGIRMSFGPSLLESTKQQAAFRALPAAAILLESDEMAVDMADFYTRAAALCGLDPLELVDRVRANLRSCGIELE
jgi:TatD DNase family protein